MKLTFLCTTHREWLSSQPHQAIHCCENSCETGWILYQQKRLDEALPYTGSAFETAEILLSSKASTEICALEWFFQTLSGLTLTLKNLGRFEGCKSVYHMAINRLQQELQCNSSLNARVVQQISCLSNELKKLDYAQWAYFEHDYKIDQYQWSTALH